MGGCIFDKYQRGIPSTPIPHGWSSAGGTGRPVYWVDGHVAAEKPGFFYNAW